MEGTSAIFANRDRDKDDDFRRLYGECGEGREEDGDEPLYRGVDVHIFLYT